MSLNTFGNVVPLGYTYFQKRVTPRPLLVCANAIFKWYEIHPANRELSEAEQAEARRYITVEAARLDLQQELGFVLLHHTPSVLLLLLCTWRNTNEIWEAVYYKPVDTPHDFAVLEFQTSHRGTFCVWELAPVWHERNAWVQFLSSPRDEVAKQAYLDSQVAGEF